MQDPDASHIKAVEPGLPFSTVPVEVDAQLEFAIIDFARAYNALAAIIHDDNIKKGFWPKKKTDRNVGEALMLAVTELSECLEANRKELSSDHIPDYKGEEEEVADCIIRLMDLGQGFNWLVAEALGAKLKFNRTRPFKHGKKF